MGLTGIGVACEPTTSAVRVAARVLGVNPSESRIDGQLLLVRLLASSEAASAYAALLEIGEQFCRPSTPRCDKCPMRRSCSSAGAQRDAPQPPKRQRNGQAPPAT
jgi:adenine-specific DNA glycosylase